MQANLEVKLDYYVNHLIMCLIQIICLYEWVSFVDMNFDIST